jgi:hypothetical protein
MAELKIICNYPDSLKQFIEVALERELRVLSEGINKTEERLYEFEAKYQLSTEEFIRRFENDEIQHRMDASSRLIFRYDNTKHHRKLNLPTYPDHKHESSEDNILPSPAPMLADILKEIELFISLSSISLSSISLSSIN